MILSKRGWKRMMFTIIFWGGFGILGLVSYRFCLSFPGRLGPFCKPMLFTDDLQLLSYPQLELTDDPAYTHLINEEKGFEEWSVCYHSKLSNQELLKEYQKVCLEKKGQIVSGLKEEGLGCTFVELPQRVNVQLLSAERKKTGVRVCISESMSTK